MKTVNTEAGASYEDAGTTQGQPGPSAREQIREVKDQVVDQAKSSLRQAKERATSSLRRARYRAIEWLGMPTSGRSGDRARDGSTRAESPAELVW